MHWKTGVLLSRYNEIHCTSEFRATAEMDCIELLAELIVVVRTLLHRRCHLRYRHRRYCHRYCSFHLVFLLILIALSNHIKLY